MRAAAVVLILLASGLSQPGGVLAQISPLERPIPAPFLHPFSGMPQYTAGQQASWEDRLVTAVGSAVLGAGIGFFMSQVDHSDWDEIPGQREASRGLWSALGGGVGLAFGLKFPLSFTGSGPGQLRAEDMGRSVILSEEVQDVSADNAYQIIRLLRPEWLNTRPPRHLGEVTPEGLPVFLDDFWYGELDSLRGIHIQTIESIRYVPATVATARWGAGYHRGVIQVITVG